MNQRLNLSGFSNFGGRLGTALNNFPNIPPPNPMNMVNPLLRGPINPFGDKKSRIGNPFEGIVPSFARGTGLNEIRDIDLHL